MTTICICGGGTMGSGIAQVTATAGLKTILYDLDEGLIQKTKSKLEKDLQTLVDKQKMTVEKKQSIFQKLHFTYDIHQCIANVVIEAVVEKLEVKTSLFRQLAVFNSIETIFATNTSSLSVSVIAKEIIAPHRVAGLHFFNPAQIMKLVEIIKGEQTTDEVIDRLLSLTKHLGKVPVVCKDSPGFIVNRVARPYYIESLRLAEEGLAGFETIDRLLESKGFRMGPFKLMDLIGNDVNYAVSSSVFEQLGYPERLKPSILQKEKVEKGELGKKTAKGYYNY